jgi:K+ transporter
VFAFIAANNERPADFFNLPTERVVELGGRIEL